MIALKNRLVSTVSWACMPLTLGMLAAHASLAPPFSYRNTYNVAAGSTVTNFPLCDIGMANPLRVVVLGVTAPGAAISSVTINGVTAAQAVASVNTSRIADIWYARVPAGTSVTISVVTSSSASSVTIHVFAGYPAALSPVDAGYIDALATSVTLTDLAKTSGGFAVFVGNSSNTSNTVVLTGTGVETITEHFDASSGSRACSCMSFIVTNSTTTNDYTATWSASNGQALSGATWGPPA